MKCQVCEAQESKYKCPRCTMLTCSLGCSKKHKTTQKCDGQAPKVWEKKLKMNEFTWGELMRDESYMSELSRVVAETGFDMVKAHLVPANAAGLNPDHLDNLNDKERFLMKMAGQKEDVKLVLLPRGMSRRKENNSRWNKKKDCMEWRVTVQQMSSSQVFASTTPLQAVISEIVGKGKAAVADLRATDVASSSEQQTQHVRSRSKDGPGSPSKEGLVPPKTYNPEGAEKVCLLQKHIQPKSVTTENAVRMYYRIADTSKALRECLKEKIILEWPIFELWEPKELTKALNNGQIAIEGENDGERASKRLKTDNTSSESDTSSDSDESADDEDTSEEESFSDEEPAASDGETVTQATAQSSLPPQEAALSHAFVEIEEATVQASSVKPQNTLSTLVDYSSD